MPLDKRHGVQIFACVNTALHVALERNVVDSTGSFTNEIWLEQHFHVKETFIVESDDVSVWENVLDLIVDGASAVSLFVMRSTIPWKMTGPPNGTTLAYTSSWMSTSHFVLGKKCRGFQETAGTTLRRNGNVQHRQC